MTWTPQMIATVKQHWGDKTAREIGLLIGKTRNSVCGKVNRLGLSGKPNVSGKALREPKSPVVAALPPPARRRTDWATTEGCQFLDGDPRERNFCGLPRHPDSPYCAEHYELCRMPFRREAA